MNVRMMAAVGVLAVVGSALALGAQEAQERRRTGPAGGPHRDAWRAELGLSPEQTAQIDKIRADERKQAIRRRADLAIARIDLEELMNAPAVDQKAIDAKVKTIADLQGAQLKARTDERLALRRVLTPEQQQKMKEMLRQRRGERPAGAWRERRPGQTGAPTPPPGPGGPSDEEEGEPPLEPQL